MNIVLYPFFKKNIFNKVKSYNFFQNIEQQILHKWSQFKRKQQTRYHFNPNSSDNQIISIYKSQFDQQNQILINQAMMRDKQQISAQISINTLQSSDQPQGWTNNVLIYQSKQKTHLYVPCYVRTKLKNIVSLDAANMMGKINIVIIFSLYYGELSEYHPQVFEWIQQNIVLKFKIDPAVKLQEGLTKYKDRSGEQAVNYVEKNVNQERRMITYSIRRMLTVPLNCQVFWSPFEFYEYVVSIEVPIIKMEQRNTVIYFNLMNLQDGPDNSSVAFYTQEGDLGQYGLAQTLVKVQFTNKRFFSGDNHIKSQIKSSLYESHRQKAQTEKDIQNDEEKTKLVDSQKTQSFKHGHIAYPVYRKALVAYINLLFPVVILGFLNLGIFFQNERAGKRMINVAILMVSYIAFLPNIRQKLPPTNKLVISQILLFSMASLTILSMAHTIKVRNIQKYELQWQQDGLYIAAFVLTIIIVLALVLVAAAYMLYIKTSFIKKFQAELKKFDRSQWSNEECDKQFNNLRQNKCMVDTLQEYIKNYSILKPLKKVGKYQHPQNQKDT